VLFCTWRSSPSFPALVVGFILHIRVELFVGAHTAAVIPPVLKALRPPLRSQGRWQKSAAVCLYEKGGEI
jgi:hypothetical protein